MPAWRDAGARMRAAVCVEIVDAINARSFEIANAVMHTTGQPFVMAFQAGGPHAQDRALEAIVAGLVEQERVPASVVWEKPGRDKEGNPAPHADAEGLPRRAARRRARHRLQHLPDVERLPRPVRLAGHRQPGHRQAAPAGRAAARHLGRGVPRSVLREAGFDPDLVQLAPRRPTARAWPRRSPSATRSRIIDYTGGPSFGGWLEENGAARGQLVYTEKAGVNTIVVDSTDNLRGVLGNLAFSLTLYSGQMCTTPQNIYVPRDGIDTDEGHLSFEDFGAQLWPRPSAS